MRPRKRGGAGRDPSNHAGILELAAGTIRDWHSADQSGTTIDPREGVIFFPKRKFLENLWLCAWLTSIP
jgi:hypothetical protein